MSSIRLHRDADTLVGMAPAVGDLVRWDRRALLPLAAALRFRRRWSAVICPRASGAIVLNASIAARSTRYYAPTGSSFEGRAGDALTPLPEGASRAQRRAWAEPLEVDP